VYGLEIQKGIFSSATYKNKLGNPDSILTNDEIDNWRYSIFSQADWMFGDGWNISAGASYNKSYVGITRQLVYPVVTLGRTFDSEIAPRIALMKSFSGIHVYASATKGFSPPTTAELLPGTSVINTTLQAETGYNYEAGVKSSNKKFNYELVFYHYDLKNAISQRKDSTGGDYYVNAGKRKQQGIEAIINWQIVHSRENFIDAFDAYVGYTLNVYRYEDYKVINQDYTGNVSPGTPKNNITAGLDISAKNGLYVNLNLQWVDKIYLNDANSEFAGAYTLLAARIGWHFPIRQLQFDAFAAGDNLLDQVYSLGNDINGTGGRYYNAAPRRNYSAGLRMAIGRR
jgi:iron complex outermembrane receptor protein